MSEPKDAAAARKIIQGWKYPMSYEPKEYVGMMRDAGPNSRVGNTPALRVIKNTPPMPELAPRGKAVAL